MNASVCQINYGGRHRIVNRRCTRCGVNERIIIRFRSLRLRIT